MRMARLLVEIVASVLLVSALLNLTSGINPAILIIGAGLLVVAWERYENRKAH